MHNKLTEGTPLLSRRMASVSIIVKRLQVSLKLNLKIINIIQIKIIRN